MLYQMVNYAIVHCFKFSGFAQISFYLEKKASSFCLWTLLENLLFQKICEYNQITLVELQTHCQEIYIWQ